MQGSALYDATLGDEDLLDEMYQEAIAEQSSKRKRKADFEDEARPPRRGYSREVEAIYDLTDNLIALRAEMGKWPSSKTEKVMSRRPWFPAELTQARMRTRAKGIRDDKIAAAQARWKATRG